MFGLSLFLLLAALVAIGVAFFLPVDFRRWPRVGAYVAIGLAVVCLGFASFVQVQASHMGMVTTFGAPSEAPVLHSGGHFILPVSQVKEVFIGMDVSEAKDAEAASRDLQKVHSTLTMNYSVDPEKVKELFALTPNFNYEQKYVIPALYEVFKAVVSHYTAEELIAKRQEVSGAILAAMNAKLAPYHLRVQSINLVNFGFSKAFDTAIEEKVTASQKAATAERNLEKAKFEAQARVAQAEGEAKAIAIQAAAVEKQGGVGYVQLQAIEKWNGVLPTTMAGGAVPFVNLK